MTSWSIMRLFRHKNLLMQVQKTTHLQQVTPKFSILPEYTTYCFPGCTDAHSSWGIILYQDFHFLTPAPLPPPLIQTQLGKYFQQENNIVTLNQLYKKRKWMTNEFWSKLYRKQILRKRINRKSFCNAHDYEHSQMCSLQTFYLSGLYLRQKAAFPSK